LTTATPTKWLAGAAGFAAALGLAFQLDSWFWLSRAPDIGGTLATNLLLLAGAVLFAWLEPKALARLFKRDERQLRRRLWFELGAPISLALLRDVWAPALPLAGLLLVTWPGLRAASVWVTAVTPPRQPVWPIVFLAATTLLALVHTGNGGAAVLIALACMAATGLVFLRSFRAWAATEGFAALPAALPLLVVALGGPSRFGVAGLAAWGVGRLWTYPKWLARRGYGWLMLASLVIAFALIEVGLRASPWSHALETPHLSADVQRHDVLFWIRGTAFNHEMQFGVGRVKIRGRERIGSKDPKVTRVICCGGSTTYGVDLPIEQTWVALAEADLRRRGRSIELFNAGEPGYTTLQIQLLLRHYLVPDYRPDGVILYLGYNDSQLARGPYTEREFWRMWQAQRAGDPPWTLRVGRQLQRLRSYNFYTRTLLGTWNRLRTDQVTLSTPQEFSQSLSETLAYLQQAGIRTLVAAEAHQVDEQIYRRIMAHVAPQYGAGFVDVYEKLRRDYSPQLVHTDPVHLTPLGNEAVARYVADAWAALEAPR
jgi:lysophospholipase L1-like esterase